MLRAVVETAPHRWYPIGLALGYTEGQVTAIVDGLPEHADKMLKIVNTKAMGVNCKELAQQLLHACETMSPPIIEEVRSRLQEL